MLKQKLRLNTLVVELHNAAVYDAHGEKHLLSRRFTADRRTAGLTMAYLEADGTERRIRLEKREMNQLLRWAVRTLEIFMWPEDDSLTSDETRPEEKKRGWRVHLEYANAPDQDIVCYPSERYDRPNQLVSTLLEYFEPSETPEFDVEDILFDERPV